MVKVLLDGQEIATAKKLKRGEVIEFDFNHESTLEIIGQKKGAIQFNDFEVLSCQSTTAATTTTRSMIYEKHSIIGASQI